MRIGQESMYEVLKEVVGDGIPSKDRRIWNEWNGGNNEYMCTNKFLSAVVMKSKVLI